MLDVLQGAFLHLWWLLGWLVTAAGRLLSEAAGLPLINGSSGKKRVTAAAAVTTVSPPKKLPTSIGLLYNVRSVDEEEVVAFVLQCVAGGIDRVVIYDPWGDAKELAGRLRLRLGARISVTAGLEDVDDVTDDVTATKRRLVLLSATEGRGAIVHAARVLSRSPSTTVTPAALSAHLGDWLLDEISLVLLVGSLPSHAGFPPWPLRVTEFVPCGGKPPSSPEEFESCLEAYMGRDRRLGR